IDGRKAMLRKGQIGSMLNATGAAYINEYQKVAVEESRLKIPVLFGLDVIHGYETTFPVPLAQAASWDPEAIERAEAVASKEASAAGIRWTFTPMVDIARDPRWGRVMEGSGEDTYLGSVIAAARVRGFQGKDPSAPDKMLACAKHFVGYGAAEGGRDYNTVDVSERSLRETYFPPFRAAVNAGVATFMTAFNDVSGTPATASRFLFTDVLRGEWGFKGFVVSDWKAIDQLRNHGVAETRTQAGVLSFKAGVDMDMVDNIYLEEFAKLIENKTIPIAAIDESVRRILRMKAAAGLFERPYADPAREAKEMRTEAHMAEARSMAQKSIVLLKNDKQILPLAKAVKSIAVIGPHADNKVDPLGEWAAKGDSKYVVSLLEGIKAAVPKAKVTTAPGTDVQGEKSDGIAEAVRVARAADVVILAVGEAKGMSGEAKSRTTIDLPGTQKDLVKAVHKTGKPIVLVLANGRPLALPWEAENFSTILETWLLGSQSGNAIADVIFGDYNPTGKLPITFPRSLGQVPLYYNAKMTGRPFVPNGPSPYTSRYLDSPNTPLWAFGHGLSYTRFEYANLTVQPARIPPGGTVTVTVDLKNVGTRPGTETAQLYIRDLVGSTSRPVKELRGFQRVTLKPGEAQTLKFSLGKAELALLDSKWQPVVEPGQFQVWVGPNSVEGPQTKFEVVAGTTTASR
ncbi:MAG TPA: glycoside hydrolase family 3 N-terminal domain-containing protein, partial [Polyangia bacterium]